MGKDFDPILGLVVYYKLRALGWFDVSPNRLQFLMYRYFVDGRFLYANGNVCKYPYFYGRVFDDKELRIWHRVIRDTAPTKIVNILDLARQAWRDSGDFHGPPQADEGAGVGPDQEIDDEDLVAIMRANVTQEDFMSMAVFDCVDDSEDYRKFALKTHFGITPPVEPIVKQEAINGDMDENVLDFIRQHGLNPKALDEDSWKRFIRANEAQKVS